MLKPQKGQGLVEICLVFVVVAVIVFGLIALFENQSNKQSSGGLANFIDQLLFDSETRALAAKQAEFQANEHALSKHPEASDIMRCLEQKGPYQVWRDRYDKHKFYALCGLETGGWGFAVCTDTGSNKTAFSPGDGGRKATFDYVAARATRYLLGLPAGCK